MQNLNLPERTRYSISELAKHWGCDESRVRHYIFDQKILRLSGDTKFTSGYQCGNFNNIWCAEKDYEEAVDCSFPWLDAENFDFSKIEKMPLEFFIDVDSCRWIDNDSTQHHFQSGAFIVGKLSDGSGKIFVPLAGNKIGDYPEEPSVSYSDCEIYVGNAYISNAELSRFYEEERVLEPQSMTDKDPESSGSNFEVKARQNFAATLPPKSRYTFDEVVDRWGCDPSVLHNYIYEQEILRLSGGIEKIYTTTRGEYSFRSLCIAETADTAGDLHAIGQCSIHDLGPIPKEFFIDALSTEWVGDDATYHFFGGAALRAIKIIIDGAVYLPVLTDGSESVPLLTAAKFMTTAINVGDPFISLTELTRFEKEHSIFIDTANNANVDVCGPYTTELLTVLNAVVEEFWRDGAPQGPQKKVVVVAWILEKFNSVHGISENIAKAIDTITRSPEGKKKIKRRP